MQLAVASMTLQRLEFTQLRIGFGFRMQTAVKKRVHEREQAVARNLMDLRRGEHGVLDHIDLPEDDARRLMELGFLPGHTVTSAHSAPGGGPRVFRVDGTEIALRRETARRLILRQRASGSMLHISPNE